MKCCEISPLWSRYLHNTYILFLWWVDSGACKIKHLIKGIIDSILNINQEDEGCNIYDYVYVLAKGVHLDYKKKECQAKLLKIYHFILSRQHKDGGWSYFKNKTRKEMYGTKIPHGENISDMHGTTLMCMSLWMIDHACELNFKLNRIIS